MTDTLYDKTWEVISSSLFLLHICLPQFLVGEGSPGPTRVCLVISGKLTNIFSATPDMMQTCAFLVYLMETVVACYHLMLFDAIRTSGLIIDFQKYL